MKTAKKQVLLGINTVYIKKHIKKLQLILQSIV